jgi:hypothetical protein
METKLGGPKTEAGKAISRLNAITHGLLSKEVVLEGEDTNRLEKLTENIFQEIQPIGELESFFVDRIVSDIWRLRRAFGVERNQLLLSKARSKDDVLNNLLYSDEESRKMADELPDITNEQMDKILRYITSIERSLTRALHELQRLQSVRCGQEITAPIVVDINSGEIDKS